MMSVLLDNFLAGPVRVTVFYMRADLATTVHAWFTVRRLYNSMGRWQRLQSVIKVSRTRSAILAMLTLLVPDIIVPNAANTTTRMSNHWPPTMLQGYHPWCANVVMVLLQECRCPIVIHAGDVRRQSGPFDKSKKVQLQHSHN